MTEYLIGSNDFDPEAWHYAGCFYQGPSDDEIRAYRGEMMPLMANLRDHFGRDDADLWQDVAFHENGGCRACGAAFSHGVVFVNSGESPEAIAIGHICAVNYFGADRTIRDIKATLKARKGEAKAEARRQEFRDFVERDRELSEAFTWGIEPVPFANDTMDRPRDAFVEDVYRFGLMRGYISPGQAQAVINAHKRGLEREAQRAKDEANRAPAPAGHTVIEGRIVSAKYQDNPYGGYYAQDVLKILVADDRGFRVWVTCPKDIRTAVIKTIAGVTGQSILDALKGVRVRMTATLQPKKDDPTFAFGKLGRGKQVAEVIG